MLAVEAAAFGRPDEANLVAALLDDPTARPVVNLLAELDGRPVGHVLFTVARVVDDHSVVPASLLAPLAVAPEAQRRGVGLALIRAGVEALAARDVSLVFVLGHSDYYRVRCPGRVIPGRGGMAVRRDRIGQSRCCRESIIGVAPRRITLPGHRGARTRRNLSFIDPEPP